MSPFFSSVLNRVDGVQRLRPVNSIRNTATGLLVVAYGDLKERATIDCAYLNKTELRYDRPAIFEVTTETTSQPRPPAPAAEESAGPQ